MRLIVLALSGFYLAGCGQAGTAPDSGAASNGKDSAQEKVVVNAAAAIPMYRDKVSKEPVANYRVKTDNPLNDWYFSVKLLETKKTFHYVMRFQFEEITGTDTLKLPNFGTLPQPEIRKGPEQYSCIIGFLDKDKQFREYKKVYVVGDRLKVTALKHYAVATYQEE